MAVRSLAEPNRHSRFGFLGRWEYPGVPFPNMGSPAAVRGWVRTRGFAFSSWWSVGCEPARYCAPSGTRQMGHDRALIGADASTSRLADGLVATGCASAKRLLRCPSVSNIPRGYWRGDRPTSVMTRLSSVALSCGATSSTLRSWSRRTAAITSAGPGAAGRRQANVTSADRPGTTRSHALMRIPRKGCAADHRSLDKEA